MSINGPPLPYFGFILKHTLANSRTNTPPGASGLYPAVLVSYSCCHKEHKFSSLHNTYVSFCLLEVRSLTELKSRCWQGFVLSGSSKGGQPNVRLISNFRGCCTHQLMALFHLQNQQSHHSNLCHHCHIFSDSLDSSTSLLQGPF